MLGVSNERRLILPAVFALAFQNELQYRYISARINSADDEATTFKNLVNFCLVTPDMTGLICENRLHTFIRHSETPWYIGTPMGALSAAINLVSF